MNPKERIEQERASLGALRQWMGESLTGLVPAQHEAALGDLLSYIDALSEKKASGRALTVHFLRAIGVMPKSEKSKKYGLGPQTGDITSRIARVSRHALRKWLALSRKQKNQKGEAVPEIPFPLSEPQSADTGKEKFASLVESMGSDDGSDVEEGEDDLSPEAFDALCKEALGERGEADSAYVSVPDKEALFGHELEGFISNREEERGLDAEPLESIKASKTDTISSTWKVHNRVGFEIVVENISVKVESAFSRESGASVRANTSDLGPERSRITWNGLVSLMTLMVGYLVPANRIALLLGGVGAYFSAARCVKHLKFVAQRLLPIHLAHARALAGAKLLQTDDTPARCPELSRARRAHEDDPETPLPWRDWKSRREKEAVPPSEDQNLAHRIAYELGFANENKTGGPRKSFNTTVLIGKAIENDLQSFIVLYHSHLGQAGDLLAHILTPREMKNPEEKKHDSKKRTLFLVSDLLKTNPPTSDDIRQEISLVWGGCMHHARRNFVLCADDDYINCMQIVMLFDAIAMYERELTEHGRREENVRTTREKITGPLWQVILLQSRALSERWSKSTPVGKAARFVINHFEKLTVHTEHPKMPDNNTLSERMLRAEKLMHRASLFRWSIEGRAAWNVVRGVYQTCQMAGVDFRAYLRHVLTALPAEVSADPEAFTPHAFAKRNKA
jgi:Transposase IS66 family